MAVAVYANDDVFRSLAYGAPRSEDREFLRDHIESAAARLGRGAADFVNRARDRFNSFDLRALDRKLDAIKRKVRHAFDDDTIRPMVRIGDFQQAGINRQRWIMANPKARRLWQAGRMRGYEGSYVDMHKGKIGDDHPDYQIVVNGLCRVKEDGSAIFEQFFDCYDEDGREEISFDQQTTIHDVIWANLEAIIAAGRDDPTDEDNGSL